MKVILQDFIARRMHKPAWLKRILWKASLLTMLISLLAFSVVLAASGVLDTTFSQDGLVTSFVIPSAPDRWDIADRVAIQPDGKIVAAGWTRDPNSSDQNFALIRYNKNGSLDTTFSGDGRVTTNLGGVDYVYGLAVQSWNGKIVVAGRKCDKPVENPPYVCNLALARYNKNGSLDTSFSGDGKIVVNFGSHNGSVGGIVLQPDHKIVVAGYMWNGNDYDFAVYRLRENGSLDPAFGAKGQARVPFETERNDYADALALQSDGKIVVSGHSGDSNSSNNDFALARLNPNGTRDTSFSGDGRVTTNFGGNDYSYGLDGHQDGRIVLVGQKIDANGAHFIAIARYKPNGALDTTFNGTGKKLFRVGPAPGTWHSWAADVIVQPNNQIVVLANTEDFISIVDIVVIRLNNNGGFDKSFGANGKMFIDFGGGDYGYDLAKQPVDGRYVLAGDTSNGIGGVDFALARVLP